MYSNWQRVDGTTLAYAGDEQQREADIAERPDQGACPCTCASGLHGTQLALLCFRHNWMAYSCYMFRSAAHVILGNRTVPAASAPTSLSKRHQILRVHTVTSAACRRRDASCCTPPFYFTAVFRTPCVFSCCMLAVGASAPARLSCPAPAAVRMRRSRQSKLAPSEKPADRRVQCPGAWA